METLRIVIRWIGGHKIWSGLVLLGCIAGAAYARTLIVGSQGVLSEPLKRGAIVESVYGIGTVMANRSFQIKAGVTGTIFDIYVKEGDPAKKGEKLINIDGVVYRAPFAGTVTSVPFKVGENVFANTTVLTLVDLRDRYLVVSLEQQGALRVKSGQEVRLSFESQREKGYSGVVESLYSSDTNFLARIHVPELPENVLPGMTADVAIAIRRHEGALLAPVAGLEEGRFLRVKRNRALPQRVEVVIGIVDKSMAEITSGDIREDDRVLIRKQP